MTGQDAMNLVMARLAGRSNATLRTDLLTEMNQVQSVTLEQGEILPWFLITTDATLALTIATRALSLPSNFLRELEEDTLVEIQDSTGVWNSMTKRTYEENRKQYDDADTSDLPRYYSIVGSEILVFPLPTVASPVRLRYFASQDVVADTATSTTNGWLAHASDLLIAETVLIGSSQYLYEDADKILIRQGAVQRARTRLHNANVAREEANMNRTMG